MDYIVYSVLERERSGYVYTWIYMYLVVINTMAGSNALFTFYFSFFRIAFYMIR